MVKVKLLILIALVLGALLIKEKYDLSTTTGKVSFIKEYFSWTGKIFNNVRDLTKTITGEATKKEWLPENTTLYNLKVK